MPADLGRLLAAVRDDWERGKVIAERAGIDSRTAGPRLASLVRDGFVAESWTDRHRGVRLYRRGPAAPPPPEGDAQAYLLGVELGDIHPCDEPGGWPEFEVTLRFYVASDDPALVEVARRRVFEQDWRLRV